MGEREVENETLNVRTRDNKVHGEHSIQHVIDRFKYFKQSRIQDAEDKFWSARVGIIRASHDGLYLTCGDKDCFMEIHAIRFETLRMILVIDVSEFE